MWGIPGNVGSIAAQSVAELIAQQQLEEETARQAAMEQARLALDRERLSEDRRRHDLAERANSQERKLRDALVTAGVLDSMFDPTSSTPMELDEVQRAALEGTPFSARVQNRATLPARGVVPELEDTASVTPRAYAMLAPTGAQQAERLKVVTGIRKREAFDQLRNDPNTPDKIRTLMNLEHVGMNAAPIGPAMLETAADRQAKDDHAFGEFQRRAGYQDELIRGRQPQRRQGLSTKDMASLIRQSRRDAMAEYKALAGPTGRVTGDDGEVVDLEDFIDQRVQEHLDLLEELEAADETAPPVSSGPRPGPNGRGIVFNLRRRDPKAPGAGRRMVNLTPIQPMASHGRGSASPKVLRYDAQGNRVP